MSRVSQGNHSNLANVIFFPLFKACLLVHLLSLCQGQGDSFGSWLQCYDAKKEVNGATSVIWMKQKTQKGGLLNLIYKYFEPVPPLIVSLTSDRNTFVETFSPNARARFGCRLFDSSLLRTDMVAINACLSDASRCHRCELHWNYVHNFWESPFEVWIDLFLYSQQK